MDFKYQRFIEDNFMIKNKRGKVVPFIFNKVQDEYNIDLVQTYGNDLVNIRDQILKARKEGFSSLILAYFATDFIVSPDPIASVCISDTKDETKKLFSRAKYFIGSYLAKKNQVMEDLCETVSSNELKNRLNGAVFWIGTAGAKAAARVESVQNLHFSEGAHFQDTDIITARETYEGAMQMVDQGIGKIFDESTARGYGNQYQIRWELAAKKRSEFRDVFFSASRFYSPEWLAKKRKQFTTEAMFKQEYPETPDEAFMASGSKFFDYEALNHLRKEVIRKPLVQGRPDMYGNIL
jgi:hypothetical protein